MAKSPGVRQTRPSLHKKAYVFRVAPGRIDRLEEALNCNEIIIGWGAAPDLTDASLSLDDFREAIKIAHYGDDVTYRRAGQAARHMWRFIREMADGHLVVVPHGQRLYVAQINRPAYYDPSRVDGTAYRRPVTWLNKTAPLMRSDASAKLQHRMDLQGTSHDATDLLADILHLPLQWAGFQAAKAVDLTIDGLPGRVVTEVYRIIRDTAVAKDLKKLHGDRCQICGDLVELAAGQTYSEAHHIQPLGSEHNGPDTPENILVLCPNCHARCDYGAIKLDLDAIRTVSHHRVGRRYVAYHNKIWRRKTGNKC